MKLSVLAFALLGAASFGAFSFAGELPATRSIASPEGFSSACQRYGWLCSSKGGSKISDENALALIKNVNRKMNSSIRPVEDRVVYGRASYWALPKDGRGDCEDYAIAKTKALLDAGFPANRMSISVVLDRAGNNHAVLLVKIADGEYVLDNLTNSIRSWETTGYTYLARQKYENKAAWEVVLAGPRAKQFNEI
ncbi:transglutaminase-like cysteine peptidase [Agrobacterium larrymoorei]|uniref:transglutaminase-like cysteine peptidase n=1 Tax=Agrobacterium larrymoorei TaxID=160699 RepID=UPI001F2BAAD7|nr:transglutaminase-like cysteine peptidase [Agrobacterium larrymoorei]NTJ42612.1 transglutaminase-like cysteine peptidase [Agrobacterium larrymoorei]